VASVAVINTDADEHYIVPNWTNEVVQSGLMLAKPFLLRAMAKCSVWPPGQGQCLASGVGAGHGDTKAGTLAMIEAI
jgi:hypothetical protein